MDSPIYGFLASDHVLDCGEPLVTAEHINPRCEPEIVFVMGARPGRRARARATEVLAATAGVAVGIEVLDSRYTDYRFTMPDVVADNASAGRYVIGTPVPPAGIDLRLVGVVLEQNGDVVATASGAASLGHPAAAVAWLVRSLASSGEGLRAGDVILSGGLTAATPVVGGRRRSSSASTGSARSSWRVSVTATWSRWAPPTGRDRWVVEHDGRSFVVFASPRRAGRHRRALPPQAGTPSSRG